MLAALSLLLTIVILGIPAAIVVIPWTVVTGNATPLYKTSMAIVRVALRVTPGALGELDVRGAERVVLPIVPAAGKPVDLELAPGVYSPKTTEVTVAWGPAGSSAT